MIDEERTRGWRLKIGGCQVSAVGCLLTTADRLLKQETRRTGGTTVVS